MLFFIPSVFPKQQSKKGKERKKNLSGLQFPQLCLIPSSDAPPLVQVKVHFTRWCSHSTNHQDRRAVSRSGARCKSAPHSVQLTSFTTRKGLGALLPSATSVALATLGEDEKRTKILERYTIILFALDVGGSRTWLSAV